MKNSGKPFSSSVVLKKSQREPITGGMSVGREDPKNRVFYHSGGAQEFLLHFLQSSERYLPFPAIMVADSDMVITNHTRGWSLTGT
jgi:hypothetical protein